MCISGLCSYTDCIAFEEDSLSAVSETTGVDSIISMSSRFIIFMLAIVALALIFPVLKLHNKVKVIAIIGFILISLTFVIYFIQGPEIFENIFGRYNSEWSSGEADRIVLDFLNSKTIDVDEKLITARKSIFGGKEYKIRDDEYESSIVIIKPKQEREITGNKITIMGKEVSFDSYAFHDKYVYRDGKQIVIVQGDKEEAKKIVYTLLEQNKYNETNSDNNTQNNTINIKDEEQSIGIHPEIKISSPKDYYTNKNIIQFAIWDNDSLIDYESLDVKGVNGFDKSNCFLLNSVYNCSFSFEPRQGTNTITLSVKDEEGHYSSKQKIFFFDNIKPQIKAIYPKNNSYINTENIHFLIKDDSELAVEFDKIININDCSITSEGLECDNENANLTEGVNTIKITAEDKAGNIMSSNLEFTYDTTRPRIEITDKGFILSDNFKLKNDSLMLNKQKYSISNCYKISNDYHCKYTERIQEISIMDEAGNYVLKDNKLRR